MAQERFWKELFQLKVHINYVEAHIHEAEKYDRRFKMFMAVSSSASIGAWAIWKDLSFLWAAIIALSQVIAAISPHLPYRERLKTYASMLHELEEVFIQAEAKWHDVALGKYDEGEINKARTNLRLQKQKILKKHLPSTVIPDDSEKADKAEELALSYFSTFYPS
ncbi:hypothetical protein HA052_22180 [Chromobacterium haemolyticum]|uniref:SMODS and SLOG-associating 2TM effector domain-containing protein n=1 Tax=Chromobacterium fluminis TaxID=3044269 RepID=A0ABX0LHH3_9NEIS|nr:hypothetical protein [Chromobacterium haemolyticum]NHR07905.1 hypothetical protein [Chromobacterium haemolyticum]